MEILSCFFKRALLISFLFVILFGYFTEVKAKKRNKGKNKRRGQDETSPASVILTANKNRTNESSSTSVNTYASKILVPSINIAPEGEVIRSNFEGTQNTQTKLDPIVGFIIPRATRKKIA